MMDPLLANWLLLMGVLTVALASPGPDFVMAIRNSILSSRRAGIMTAVGFGLGVAVHVAYCLGGLAIVISQSVLIFGILKMIGAAYLFYVGYKALRSNGFSAGPINGDASVPMSDLQALRSGFITNLFNPKATMFFLALFTQIISPDVGMAGQVFYGMTCIVMTMIWFSIVATALTTPAIRNRFLRFSKWIDRTCGVALIALGAKLVLTKAPV